MNKGKLLLTGLLLAASLLTGILLFTIPAPAKSAILELSDLYDQVDLAIEEAGLEITNFRKFSIEIDSTFSRSVYRIEVPPRFSKTSFHLALHHQLIEKNIHCPAKFNFPEENMDIHLIYNNTVFRTIRLITSERMEESGENG